jgi:Mor family transcriptional regulator
MEFKIMSASDHITEILQESDIVSALKNVIGFKDEIAGPLALNILKEFQAKWGGRQVYIAVDKKITDRNQRIKEEFNGNNHAEICKRYNISLRTLYRTINKSNH